MSHSVPVTTFVPDRESPAAGDEVRIPREPGAFRQFLHRHPHLADATVAGAYLLLSLFGTIGVAIWSPQAPPLWVTLLQTGATLTAAIALLLRRLVPWLVLAVAWATFMFVYPYHDADVGPVLLALYALAVYRSPRAAWIGFAATAAIALVPAWSTANEDRNGFVLTIGPDDPSDPYVFLRAYVPLIVLLLTATLIGTGVGNRARYVDALIARARALTRERDQQAELGAVLERTRIAREMHDIVSHGLSVMITLAEGAAATVERNPSRAADTMRSVAETGRDALGEMRRTLNVLRRPGDTDGSHAPQPGVADIPALIDRFRTAGITMHFSASGPPVKGTDLQLSVYRIFQEALTNTLRYAPGATVHARIDHHDHTVIITVADNGPARVTSASGGAGRGLAGLRERVALYHGTLHAGPHPKGRGWRVEATLHCPTTGSTESEPTR